MADVLGAEAGWATGWIADVTDGLRLLPDVELHTDNGMLETRGGVFWLFSFDQAFHNTANQHTQGALRAFNLNAQVVSTTVMVPLALQYNSNKEQLFGLAPGQDVSSAQWLHALSQTSKKAELSRVFQQLSQLLRRRADQLLTEEVIHTHRGEWTYFVEHTTELQFFPTEDEAFEAGCEVCSHPKRVHTDCGGGNGPGWMRTRQGSAGRNPPSVHFR